MKVLDSGHPAPRAPGRRRARRGVRGRVLPGDDRALHRPSRSSLARRVRRINVFVPVLAHRFAPRAAARRSRQAEGTIVKETARGALRLRPQRRPLADGGGLPGISLATGWTSSPVARAGRQLNGAAVTAMAEKGIDLVALPPAAADEVIRAADVVVTMGCGDACPFYPGKRYLDWELEDQAGQVGRRRPADPRRDRAARQSADCRARPRRGLRTCRWADSSAGQPYQAPGRDQRMVTAVEREPTDSTGWSSVPALRRVRSSGVHDEDRGRLVGRTPGRSGRRDRGDPPAARRPQPRGAAVPRRDRRQAEDGNRPCLQGGRRAGVLTARPPP